MHAGQEVVVEWEEGGREQRQDAERDRGGKGTTRTSEKGKRLAIDGWREMGPQAWKRPQRRLFSSTGPPCKEGHGPWDGVRIGVVWMGATHAHQTQTNNEPQLLAPSLIRLLLLPPSTGTRQDGERNHLWEVVFNILVTSTGRRFDWNLVPDMILAPSRHLQRLQSAKERQPAGRPSTLLKSVSALAPILMSSNSPRIGSTHAAALTNWVPCWVLSGAQRSQTSPSSPPVPDFLSVVWGKVASRGVVWSNSLDWPVVVEVLVGVRKQEIEGPGLEQGTICLEVSDDDTYRQVIFVKPQASE
ncbi:hypothetical protein CTAM01_04587 [Colletotrichum tamarilloi]|uniref:Uncharacterized protein n=1 Tax=Colletotrichum tamarilloi TaxID=1209934 RepID=A0ABQ9RGP4_9PEZI|nr:uncharacterized protein CTAM01_04587 [Colletotrichum tamarilloi]KAK1503275.1 hypothetical protein CTAM01_04587 [Colletotrichum tamarilloi]